MAVTDKRFCKGTFGNTIQTLYTTPASTTAVIKAITICNKSASQHTISLKLAGTFVIYNHAIGAYDTITIPFIDQILSATELIEGNASSASAVNYFISGKEIT